MLSARRLLVLAPHTDDECNCSATLQVFKRSGADLFCAVFSICEESVPEGLPKDVLHHEFRASMAALGIPENNQTIFSFPVRHFPSCRQEILEELIRLRKQISPDVVLLPSQSDIHQDHATISAEGLRAFKHSTVLGYEMPWNTPQWNGTTFIAATEGDLQVKLESISCYKSQAFRPYATPDFFRSLALIRGTQAGVPLAEAFDSIRLMLLESAQAHA